MKGLPDGEIIRCAESGEGYALDGIMLYPATVRDYGIFYACASALTLRLSMLPAKYGVMPYAEAIFAMALDPALQDGENASCFAKFVHLLALSMRVRVEDMQFKTDAEDITKLRAIIVKQATDEWGESLIRLEPRQLGQIREIIAALNGKELPDEADNAEIVQAEADIRASGITALNVDINDLKASVAAYYRTRLKDLNGWTIYEFEKARAAIERMTRCVICGIGEAGGMVRYEKGNPFPSLFFDRVADNPALLRMDEFMRRNNGAVEMADGLPDMPMGIN